MRVCVSDTGWMHVTPETANHSLSRGADTGSVCYTDSDRSALPIQRTIADNGPIYAFPIQEK